jgi:radical SAM protein with 4Fe4S-binding SPASM domain
MASGFGLRAALITNGLPVSERVARELAELRPSHVGVSIDGACDDVHDAIRGVAGARRRAWAAVRRLRGAGLPVTVITTLVRSNVAELEALHDQLAAEGGLVWQLQLANGSGDRFSRELLLRPAEVLRVARFVAASRARGAGDPAIAGGHNIGHHACGVRDEEYGPRGRWRGCPGGLTAIGICSDGSVKGCLSMRECEVQGNLHQRSLVEIWRDPSCFARSRSSRPGLLRGGCARCPHGAECRGGCPETARSASGDVWDNPLCLRQAEELEAGA